MPNKNKNLYYEIADITVQLNFDNNFPVISFEDKFKKFQVETPGAENIIIRHHYPLPDKLIEGEIIYSIRPWIVSKTDNSWIYRCIELNNNTYIYAVFNKDYSMGDIFHSNSNLLTYSQWESITFFPTDQILLASYLINKEGCYFHSAGCIQDDKGLLFIGHSGAGKSTIIKMLQHQAKLLCDDRNIVRRSKEGFRLYGTWSHGEITKVSSSSAPLHAIFLLEQAKTNQAIRITDKKEIVKVLPFFIVKPLVSAEWWKYMFDLVEQIANEIPVYRLLFDKSGAIEEIIADL